MAEKKRIDEATGTSTMGHEWDGIEELDTPMPRWWLWTFYASIAFSLVYVVLYPAWPLVHGATQGVLGWTSRGEFHEEQREEGLRKAPIREALARIPIERLPEDSQLMKAAVAGGAAAYRVYCVQCHGTGAAGGKGYPNLNDDDWLWGGDLKTIHQTLVNGIRQPGNDSTRMSQMPAFGDDGILTPPQIQDVVSYVRVISRQEKPSPSARRGQAIYAENCVVCHGPNGEGGRDVGAPRLDDAIWLYGGDRGTLTETVTHSRRGVMPAWGGRLDPVTIKMLAAYVHSLGGGEALVPETPEEVKAATEKPEAATPKAVQDYGNR